ncbi:Dystrophin-1 [Dirofilaria immitis]
MLFSGSSSAKVKKDEKKEKKLEKDDRYDVQEAVFIRWGNSLADGVIKELNDFVDTKFLSIFVQLITGESFVSSGSRAQDISNALRLVDTDERFSQININELVDGNSRTICSVIWQLIQIFWKKFAPTDVRDQKLAEALKDWCVERAQRFEVQISDFISSWRDGYALNAILLSYNPELFSMNQIRDMRAIERIEHAMGLAERHLNAPRLLHPKDFYSEHLDMKSVVCYLMVLYLSLNNEAPLSKSRPERKPSQPERRPSQPERKPSQPERRPSQPERKPSQPERRLSSSERRSSQPEPQPPHPEPKPSHPEPKPSHPEPKPSHPEPKPSLPELKPSHPELKRSEQAIESSESITLASSSKPEEPIVSKTASIKTDSQFTIDSPISPVENANTEMEYSMQRNSEQPSSILESVKQSQPTNENVEIQSRKSSTSSQKSGKRRGKVMEETIVEFEECLEHVLAWLLEAEEQINSMKPIEKDNVELVKSLFKEHEMFMQSLTESQDGVGRVLHRGQQLLQKLEKDESASIVAQLLMVNSKWERIREIAMSRQNQLQHYLNTVQIEQLESIRKWLDKMEEEIQNTPSLSLNENEIEHLINRHTAIQERIENEQKIVRALSTFVAVVDESDSHFSYENLEKLLQSVGQRWMNVCEWAEMRARQLNDLSDLITQYTSAYRKILEWLDNWETDMNRLKAVDELKEENEIVDQVCQIQKLESALQQGHPDFVHLSQLAVELVSKFGTSNETDANQIRQQIEAITHRWDNIVAQIDEHSHMLVSSGKAEARQLQLDDNEEDYDLNDPTKHHCLEVSNQQENESSCTVQFTSHETIDPMISSSSTISINTVISPVDSFIGNINRIIEELQPLIEWTHQFKLNQNSDEFQNIMQIYQDKLKEIKEKEGEVNELHAEMDRIHHLDISTAQLQLAKDSFQNFSQIWFDIVTKISDALNSLSKQTNLIEVENEEETERIIVQLNEFFEKAENIISNCSQIPLSEREERVIKLQKQLQEQDKNLTFLETNHSNKKEIEKLKKHLVELQESVNKLIEKDPIIEHFEHYLRSTFPCAGDISTLISELERCDELLNELKSLKLKDPKVEQLERLGNAKRNSLADYLERSQRNDEKTTESENMLSALTDRFAALKSAKLEVPELYKQFMELQKDIQKGLAIQKESVVLNEEIMLITLSSSSSSRDRIFQKLKNRMQLTVAGWSTLEDDIDESIALLQKESKRLQQSAIREFQRNMDDLRRAIDASRDATDAEEFSEHLYNLEHLYETMEMADKELENLSTINERVAKDLDFVRQQRHDVLAQAKKRIDELEAAIRNCEQFDSSLTECQAWCNHVQLILSCRAANDISALDVPHEYKQLQKEFDDFECCIRDLREFVAKNTSDWGTPNRLQLQLDHITNQFEDLMARFVEFKQPIGLEERAERLSREVSDMENSVDEMTGVQAESCKQALDHTKEITRRLAMAQMHLEELTESGKMFVKEQILTPNAAQILTERVNKLDKKLKNLSTRNTEMAERMQNCIISLDALNSDMQKLDAVFESVESRLNAFVQSENIETIDADRITLEELLEDLNQGGSLLSKAETIIQRLAMDSFKIDENIVEQRKRRAIRLKGDLRSWIDAVKCVSEDKAALLQQFEALHNQLKESFAEMEQIENIEALLAALDRCKSDKNVFIERYRRLLRLDPEAETKFSVVLSEIEKRWNEMEKKCQKTRSSSPSNSAPPQLRHDSVGGGFRDQINLLHDLYKIANDYMDFERFPVSSINEWSRRVQDVDEWLVDYAERLKGAVEEGRRLASSGRMELDVHNALDNLDEVVDLANRVEGALKENKTSLFPIQTKAEVLDRDIIAMENVLDKLSSRDLSESTIVNATQRDLLDRQTQLDYLQRRSDDLHSCLPGTSINQPNTAMDKIHDKVRDLEEKIDASMKKIKEKMMMQTDDNSSQIIIQSKEEKESDVISTASTGGQSLMLEVHEAEDEQSQAEFRKSKSNSSELLVMATKVSAIEASESLMSLYIEMDEIEKELNQSDPLIFKNLQQKKQKLEEMDENLKKVERAIDDSQMTMDLIENEAARERLKILREWKDRRSNEIDKLIKAENSLEKNMKISHKLLDEIDKALVEIDNRNKSPELEELEYLALSLEDRLQRALAQIQHTSLKAEPILTQISEKEASVLRDRLRSIGEKWKQYENLVREKKHRLDERFTDESELNNEMELLQFWCDETETECAIIINPLNLPALKELATKLEERLNSYEAKRISLQTIERLKDHLVSAQLTDPTSKHRIRRAVSEIGKRISSIRSLLRDRKSQLDCAVNAAKNFEDDLNKLQKFCERTEKAIQLVESATIFVPSGTDLDYVRLHEAETDEIARRVEQQWKDASSVGGSVVDEHLGIIVEDTLRKWANDKEKLAVTACLPTLEHDSSSLTSEAVGEEEEEEELASGMQNVLSNIAEEKEYHISEYGNLSDSVRFEESPEPKLSTKERLLMDNVIHIGHWLTETERDASLTVDLANLESIRNAITHMQAFIDQLKIRHLDLLRIVDESHDKKVRERSEVMTVECNKILGECQRRKITLTKMLEESRAWDKLRKSLTTWLTGVQEKVIDGSKVDKANVQTLKQELGEIQEIAGIAGEMKLKMDELNELSNALLDNYRADEGHNLSHTISKLNALWSKFNDNVRIRRAVLEAALRARNDFHSALGQVEEWMDGVDASLIELNEATMNTQMLKDSVKRKKWIEDERTVRVDINAHKDVIGSVGEMGTQLIRRVEDQKEREHLKERLSHVDIRWRHLNGLADAIRTRLLNAQEEWERLFTQLAENLFWTETQSKALLEEQPVGGSLARVQEQTSFVQKLENEMKLRQHNVDECITLSHSYLMQHDLRPRMRSTSTLAPDEENDDENAELRRVGIQIKSDSDRLVQEWSELREQLNAWARIIHDANAKMEKLASTIAECQLALSNMEERTEQLRPIEELKLEELPAAVDESERLKECLARTRIYIDDANDWSGQLLASDVDLAPEPSAQLKSINDRMAKLKSDLRIRAAALERAMADFGPSSQHFLRDSVQAPWQRAVSASNHLPYYINHETEVTQWDHPAMVEIMEELTTFNQVKFSAYRTAMKLRAIQKRLCLDLLTLEDVDLKLETLNSMLGEQCLSMKDVVMCLVPLFETAQEKYPKLIHSIPLAVDLLLNFVLNVFDPARDCILRTFSFRVLLTVLCNSNLEDKYRYLYQLIANNEGVDQKKLALLLYDIIHIPRFFGEAAAFGGSNVEPSVRSCFETANYPRSISVDEFLNWLKKEPQSIVWLPVMHRLASAEFAKHQAKCNVCKMFPIIGLRYRCLQCFNVDVCQNCFFSQRLAKNHKLSHPIQEYCLPTTSGEDMRDFGLIVRNKLRSKSKTRIGYLPVQTVDEGPPLETNNVAPLNPFTEPIHNRMQLCARRLWRARGENDSPIPPSNDPGEEMIMNMAELKSPLQLLSQVEQMHKEELDQVLHKLQHENRELKKEIERRKKHGNAMGSTPNLTRGSSTAMSRSVTDNMGTGRSVPSLSNSGDDQLLREAYLLRQHKERLEHRSRILEEQNRQLETQLARLRTVIAQQQNVGSESKESGSEEHELSVTSAEEDEGIEYDTGPNRMNSLIASVDQLGRAMQSFVVSVVNDEDETNEDEDELTITGIH